MAEGNQSEFVSCPNGHKYMKKLGQCPFCPKTGTGVTGKPTDVYSSSSTGGGKTETYEETKGYGSQGGTTPNPPVNNPVTPSSPRNNVGNAPFDPNKTGFIDLSTRIEGENNHGEPVIRYQRRLVGVLFTRSIDNNGVLFNLYEGKNFIGRNDNRCNIQVRTDAVMSGFHAQLLVRGDQYVLKDEMSTGGTFVNHENIGFEPYILKDGDVIRVGATDFLFRSFI
jgi:hypothetical protein